MKSMYTEADWVEVDPLLGTMSDGVLAQSVLMSATTLRMRRRKLGIPAHTPRPFDWTDVDPFLGTMTDADLARKFDIKHHSDVTKRRKKFGIPPCKKREANAAYCPRGEVSHAASLFAVRKFFDRRKLKAA